MLLPLVNDQGYHTAIGSQYGNDPRLQQMHRVPVPEAAGQTAAAKRVAAVLKSGFSVLRSAQKDQAMSAAVCGLPTRTWLHNRLAWQLCALGLQLPAIAEAA